MQTIARLSGQWCLMNLVGKKPTRLPDCISMLYCLCNISCQNLHNVFIHDKAAYGNINIKLYLTVVG